MTVKGMTKRRLRKSVYKEIRIIPSLSRSLTIKACSEDEVEKYLSDIGNHYIDDWNNQLKEHTKNGYGLILTGFNANNKDLKFFWSPCFATFESVTFEIMDVMKLYDFKDMPTKHCLEHLTPEEMIKEFGYIFYENSTS